MDHSLKVVVKGLKGKFHGTPFVTFANNEGEKLTVNVSTRQQLDAFSIGQKFIVKVDASDERTLTDAGKQGRQ